ncbi:MAG: alpha/beta fold hydrolase, partial [Rhizobiales bacterium]|nr:alpha/beta fold hydrolase [Hyphomicrobiales bacterium]
MVRGGTPAGAEAGNPPAAGALHMKPSFIVALLACLALVACAPHRLTVGDPVYLPRLTPDAAIMADATRLPLRSFLSKEPHAIILALHGFNDYSKAFGGQGPGPWFADHGISLYAYDQRGFGSAPGHGGWAGADVMASDLVTTARLIQARHPDQPLYLMGQSMGGAVVLAAMNNADAPRVAGIILASPAVWGWSKLNPLYKVTLWTAAHTVPDTSLTGQGLGVMASDNIPLLRANGRDPLFIKETRIGTIYGLVNLMDDAYRASAHVQVPTLLLYGARDQVVPQDAVGDIAEVMRASHVALTIACYP